VFPMLEHGFRLKTWMFHITLANARFYVETYRRFAGKPHYSRIDCRLESKLWSRRRSDMSVGGLVEMGLHVKRRESTGRFMLLELLQRVKASHYGAQHRHG
jgi:hypothetical protein